MIIKAVGYASISTSSCVDSAEIRPENTPCFTRSFARSRIGRNSGVASSIGLMLVDLIYADASAVKGYFA